MSALLRAALIPLRPVIVLLALIALMVVVAFTGMSVLLPHWDTGEEDEPL